MRRLFSLLVALSLCFPVAPAGAWWKSIQQVGVAATGCAQATTFLARTSGLSGADQTRYTNLICGLNSDGVGCGTVITALYVLAAPDATTATLNLCSTSFTLTPVSSPTFTANQGYTGTGANYINTNLTPSTSGLTLNSFTVGAYDLTPGTTVNDSNFIVGAGADPSGNGISIAPLVDFVGGLTTIWDINESSGNGDFATNAQNAGFYIATRTGSTTKALYKNNTTLGTGTQPSTALVTQPINLLGFTGGGSTDQLAFAFIGSGVTSTQAGLISVRVNNFATALGINVY